MIFQNKNSKTGRPGPRYLLFCLTGALVLSGCQGTANQGTAKPGTANPETAGPKESKAAGAAMGNVAQEEETLIKWESGTVSIDGTGAAADGSIVTIKNAGTYRLSGQAAQGQVVVDAGEEDEIRLVLDNFSIANQESSAIYGVQSGRITVVLEDGTDNFVSDGASYVFVSAEEDEPDAAIFSKDDLVFEGTGTLTVEGNYQDAIRGKDNLTVKSGTYVISAVNDGIKGKDSVTVEGGTIQVDSEDDAVHTNGDVTITAGVLTLASGDDAVHADNRVVIDGGTITITESYEGLEGLTIDINGGTIALAAEDDGLNAAGGSDSSGNGGRGGDSPFAVTGDAYIRITGGELTVSASGDGIDSNGNLMFEGGVIFVEGPVSDRDGTLDYNGTGTLTGGTFVGTGSSGMTQTFSEGSTQPAIVIYYTESQPAGTEITVTDSEGKTLLRTAPAKEFSSLIFSSADLRDGSSYQVKTGETTTEITVDGIITQSGTPSGRGGGMGRGSGTERGTGEGFGDGAVGEKARGDGTAPGRGGTRGDRKIPAGDRQSESSSAAEE